MPHLRGRTGALARRDAGLPEGDPATDRERAEGEPGGDDNHPVPAQEPSGAVGQRARPREDRPALEMSPEILGQLLSREVTPRRLLAQCFHQDGVEVALQPGRPATRLGATTELQDPRTGTQWRGGIPLESTTGSTWFQARRLSHQQLEGEGTQAPVVGRRRRRLAGELLWSGVSRRHQARLGCGMGLRGFWVEKLGDPEVEQLDLALGCHQHVGGLEVAMNDEVAVA